mgnify:CR=1 FL=1
MITVTPSAVQEVRRLIEREQKPNLGLRVGVKGGGCSGMTYVISLDDASSKPGDQVFEQDGLKILVDAKSHQYLEGMSITYNQSLMGGGFEFNNPNAKKSCGCGTSFTV